ncbi:MAG: DUF4388 domain-containing protein [Acidobacteria bacterium]|nr:DUF4388 domain-containing protein [Acidobacteriota bacterium]
MKGREQRGAKRVNYICEIQCIGHGIQQLNTRINDISVTGLFIDSISCLPVGSTLTMKFALLGAPLCLSGVVRHSIPQSGMGIEFTDLQAAQREIIECLVEGRPLNPVSLQSTDSEAPQAPIERLAILAVDDDEAPLLMGNFAVINLFDVIQMIENNRVTGTLLIRSPHVTGEIYFNEGLIANAKSGGNYGTAALYKFLDLKRGHFELKKNYRDHTPALHPVSNTGLLLDLLTSREENRACS